MEAKVELINHLKELPDNNDVFQAKRELKHIFELYEKAKKECKEGTVLISYKDTITGLEPTEIKSTSKDNIYFYKL